MLNLLKCAALVCCVSAIISLNGCGNATVKRDNSDPHQLSALQAYTQGQALYEQWSVSQSATIAQLNRAEKLLAHAVQVQPENALYQLSHYNISASLSSHARIFNEENLLQAFNALPSPIQAEAISPAFVAYIRSSDNNEAMSTRINHMLRAIKQNPNNPANWLTLAELYSRNTQFRLSTSAALGALKLAPTYAQAEYQIGLNFTYLAQSPSCPTNQFDLFKSASSYFAQAIQQQNKNAYYLALSSETYLHLGLTPLALAQAKKAYSIESNNVSRMTLFNALYFSKRLNEAWLVLDEMIAEGDPQASTYTTIKAWYELETNAYNPDDVKEFASASIQAAQQQGDLSTLLLVYYLLPHYSGREISVEFPYSNPADKSLRAIIEHLLKGSDSDSFISSAEHPCDLKKRLFYRDLKSWYETGKIDAHPNDGMKGTNINLLTNEEYWRLLLTQFSS